MKQQTDSSFMHSILQIGFSFFDTFSLNGTDTMPAQSKGHASPSFRAEQVLSQITEHPAPHPQESIKEKIVLLFVNEGHIINEHLKAYTNNARYSG